MSIRNTFVRLFNALWTAVDGLRKVLHLLILLIIFSVVIGTMSSTAPSVPGKAALVISPQGNLVEQLEGDPYDRALAELLGDENPQTLVQDIVDALGYAKNDARITAVVLDLSAMPSGGLSKLQRVGDAIDDFRTSGKTVIASADYYGQGSYYLASRADEIYMHPDGFVLLRGFGIFQTYYKQAIDTLKIDWNVFRVGTHKAAVEPYLDNSMSDEARDSYTGLLDQLWTQYKQDIVQAREIEENTIEDLLGDLVDNTREVDGDLASLFLDLKFVDVLATRDELQDRISELTGQDEDDEEGYPAAGMEEYLVQMRMIKGTDTAKENVAIVVAAGEIRNGSQPPGSIGGDSTASLLRKARKDETVKAVVLRVDSPGGSAFASEIIRNEIVAIKAAGKPVVVSMSSLAASGGYWISMAADQIYATPYTITGSIGIYGMFPTYQRAMDTLGIHTDGVATTAWAGQFRPDREMSEDARSIFQLMMNKGYDDFISKVSVHRDIDKSAVDSIAQGQVWTGTDAIANGLIDEIGNIDDAIAAAAELAELDDYGSKVIEKEMTSGEQLVIDLMGGAKAFGMDFDGFGRRDSSLERIANIVERKLSPLLRFNDPKGVYAHCFCLFE
ncbi:MAG: protease-4 [Woeseiaceae bacterium]|jgi:protease-4